MFGLKKRRVYLDHAAATPATLRALEAFTAALNHQGNPSSLHQEGVSARAIIESARTEVARMLGVRSGNVIFTSGATESNTLGIMGAVSALMKKELATSGRVLYYEGGHSSLVESAKALAHLGVAVEPIPLKQGMFDLTSLSAQLTDVVLIALEAVNGETGTIFPIRDMRRVLDEYERKTGRHILLHVDASQAPRVISPSLVSLGADLLALDAQKIGGVRGAGVLAHTSRVKLEPILYGGGQQNGVRPGTENTSLIAAFAAALAESDENREAFVKNSTLLRQVCIEALSHIEGAVIHESKHQAPHILNASFAGIDTDYLLFLLDAAGFAVSTKSACEANNEGSRVVLLMTGSREAARSTLRISFGPTTQKGEVEDFLESLALNIRFLRETAID